MTGFALMLIFCCMVCTPKSFGKQLAQIRKAYDKEMENE